MKNMLSNKARHLGSAFFPLQSHQTSLCVLLYFAVASASCGINDNQEMFFTKNGGPLGSGLKELTSDYSDFSDKEASHIKTLFSTYAQAPGWPEMPRRSASISESIHNETGFKVGLKTNVLGAEAQTTANATFGLSYRSTLLLIRTAEEGNDRFTRIVNGKEELNVQEGVDFVGMCSYAASVKVGTRFLGEISLFGTGVSEQTDLTKNIEVDQGSNFFKVNQGDTVRTLQDMCLRIFREKVRQSVVDDLKRIVKMSITYEGAKESDLKKAMIAAVYGPPLKGLKIFGYEWNVEKAEASKSGDLVLISGMLVHSNPWYLAKWPQEVTYSFEMHKGTCLKEYISVNEEEGWKSAAHKLASLIRDEVYLEVQADQDSY